MIKLFLSVIFLIVLCFNIEIINGEPEFRMITLMSGPASDLGFNNMINQGRVGVSKAMDIEDSRVIEVDGHNETITVLLPIIQNEEIDFVICSSQGHTTGCKAIAKMYEDSLTVKTKFLVRGSGNTTANLVSFNYNFAISNYVSGIFAGLQTKTNKIGFLSPGAIVNNQDSFVFAFWLGAKTINPSIKFYYYNIGSWFDPDKTTKATEDLIELGCDVVGDTLDDFSAGDTMIRAGKSAIGTNGFPQKDVYGENVVYSYAYNWTKVFLPIALAVKNKTPLLNGYGDFSDNPELNFYNLDYSVTVNPTIIANITYQISELLKVPRLKHPYYCNDYYIGYGIPIENGTTNCINHLNFLKVNKPMPGMTWLGNYEIRLTKVESSQSIQNGFSIVTSILIALVLLMMLGILIFNKTPSIRSASPIFLALILSGGVLIYTGIIIWVSPATTGSCNARFWLVTLGFSTLIGSLVIKNIRIWLIFDNPELKSVRITNYHLFPWVGACLVINTILMAILTSVGDMQAINAQAIDDLDKYEFMTVCKMNKSGASTLYTILAYFATLLLVGVFVSWKIRIVDIQEFNESKAIANTLYAVSFCLFVIVPLMISPQDKQSETIILCAAGLFITTAALMIIFVPKFFRVLKYGEGGTNEMFQKSKSASSVATARAESSKSSQNSGHRTNRRGNIINDDFSDTETSITEPNKPKNSIVVGTVLASFTDSENTSEIDETEINNQEQEQQEEEQEEQKDEQQDH